MSTVPPRGTAPGSTPRGDARVAGTGGAAPVETPPAGHGGHTGALDWDDLVTSALLGVARRPVDLATLPGEVGRLAATLPGTDAPGRLLHAAALLTAQRRAGTGPLPAPPPVPAAPHESAPVASHAAGGRLAGLLARTDALAERLVDEWLALAASHGRLAPPALLPRLLDWASARGERGEVRRDRAERVAPVLGERGRWLAGHRAEWAAVTRDASGAAPSTPSDGASSEASGHGAAGGEAVAAGSTDGSTPVAGDAWTRGTAAERRDRLVAVRRSDPAAARAMLLAAGPSTLRGEERAQLYGVLADGLQPADEELLERALDDARQDVRTVAAAMLRRLPGSAQAARAAARAVPLVHVERRRLRRVLVVDLPEVDPGDRDDRALPPAPSGTGARVWLLRHLVLATPLRAWEDALDAAPDELVALPVADDLRGQLRAGWLGATRDQADARWARALLRDADHGERVALLPVLGVQERAEHVAAAVDALAQQGGRAALTHVDALLGTCPRPWPPVLTAAVLRWLAGERSTDTWHADWALRTVAMRLPTDTASEDAVRAAGLARADDDPWRARVLTVADTLHDRRHMTEELR
ncbi:DUF5691 domain-containing protein [Cellulomonas sp. NS3]|uniref:DUF5691 domain-containing protein n=1 Tax=Cellulomonas sp. NS3 TaxID=2973977 RepID=UPI0021636348|nr:DUF5691 domain-containing protein [Cellulomonas sp. NS3]